MWRSPHAATMSSPPPSGSPRPGWRPGWARPPDSRKRLACCCGRLACSGAEGSSITRCSARSVRPAGSAGLVVEEREGDRAEQRRAEDVVVGQAGQDRERVPALRAAFARPPAVAEAAVKKL